MGYSTYFSLAVKGIKYEEDYDRLMHTLDDMGIGDYALDTGEPFNYNNRVQTIPSYDGVNWYDHEEDMVKLSQQFPDYTFCLHGEGEINDDLWDEYFYRGEYERCPASVVYPEPKIIQW